MILLLLYLISCSKLKPVGNLKFGVIEHPARFDYKQTFKRPIYAGNQTHVAYFNHSGNAVLAPDYIRLTPSIPFQNGYIRCSTVNQFKEWMVEFSFSIYGKSMAGGDGIVLWYVRDLDTSVKNFYGNSADFQGLAIVFDSSDHELNRHNPFIYAIKNDGTKTLKDFKDYTSPKVHLGSCYRDYRNTPRPVFAKLTYVGNVLSLDMDLRQNGQSYSNCFKIQNIQLPTGYRFAFSSSTGDRGTDDHDIVSFETYEINPPKREHKLRPHEEEDIKAGKAFKMDEHYEKEIKKAEKTVRNTDYFEESEYEPIDVLDPQTLVRIEENQWKMIEALNLVEEKIGAPKTHPQGILTTADQEQFETRLSQKLNYFGYF